MKASKLSIGPLVVNPLLLSQICKADGSMQVAQVDCFHPASVTIEYARLFAGAPDLLEALELLTTKTDELVLHLQATNRLRPCFNLPALEVARAAIAKVTGGAA